LRQVIGLTAFTCSASTIVARESDALAVCGAFQSSIAAAGGRRAALVYGAGLELDRHDWHDIHCIRRIDKAAL